MKRVALFHLMKSFGGGGTTYLMHLMRGLRAAGIEPVAYHVTARGDSLFKLREIGNYGEFYVNVPPEEAVKIARTTPTLVTATCQPKDIAFAPDLLQQMVKKGARYVVHSPLDEQHFSKIGAKIKNPIVIRRALLRYPGAVFVPHPYVRQFEGVPAGAHRKLACSIAQVTFNKRTALILQANAGLRREQRVRIYGRVNRLYQHYTLSKKFPNFRPRQTVWRSRWGASASICAGYDYMVDFTRFDGDGGGTQYTFLEAWDAGCVPVVHGDWLTHDGDMRSNYNCVAVDGAAGLKMHLQAPGPRAAMVQAGLRKLAMDHDAAKVARATYEEITR